MRKSGYRNYNKWKAIPAAFLILFIGGFTSVKAQMFSVKSLPQQYGPPMTSAYISVIPTNFQYKPRGSGSNTQTNAFDFNDPLYRLGLDLSGLEINATAGWSLGPLNNLNYFGLEIGFNSKYPVLRTHPFVLSLPLAIKIGYTRVNDKRSSNISNDFRQNNATIGSGLHADFMLPHRIRISLEGTVNYGFSTRSLGQSSGSAWIIDSRNRIYFDRVLGQIGFVAGLDYRYTRFNGSGIEFDYGEKNIGFILGITF